MYRFIFILLSIIVLSACHSDEQQGDFSFTGIKIARYDRLQYEATVQNSFFSLQRMNTEFAQETRLLIEDVLDLGAPRHRRRRCAAGHYVLCCRARDRD